MFVALLVLAAGFASTCCGIRLDGIWQRGSESCSITIDSHAAMQVVSGEDVWRGTAADSGCGQALAVVPSVGADWLGSYDQVRVGSCEIRYYVSIEAFAFSVQHGSADEHSWPNLTRNRASMEAPPTRGGLAWRPSYMLGGGRLVDSKAGSGPSVGRSDGPLFAYEQGTAETGSGTTLVLSPLDHFTTNQVQFNTSGGAVDAMWMGTTAGPYPQQNQTFNPPPPPGTSTSSILLGRRSLKRATMAWGAIMRRYWNTTRLRGAGTTQLSYWDDNRAGYSFWSQKSLDAWGPPENLFIALRSAYAAQKIPVRQFEIDPRGIHGSHAFTLHGWCYVDWLRWNETLFPRTARSPNGTAIKTAVLGNDSAVYYMSPFCNDTVHRQQFDFVSIGPWPGGPDPQPDLAETVPADTFAFYTSLLQTAKTFWAGQMLFIDFLCFRAPHLQNAMPAFYEAGANWLYAVGAAAAHLDVEVQMCMACPHQAMQSLVMPAVTNARVNGDSGLKIPDLVYSSTLAAALGLGWSKDNLHSTGSDQAAVEQQVIFAALSLGPAGLADRLAGYPHPPKLDEAVVTNRTLAMSLCAENGQLLQPSFPLTVVDQQLAGLFQSWCDGRPVPAESDSYGCTSASKSTLNALTTYTTVDSFLSFVGVAFIYNFAGGQPVNWTMRPRYFSDLVDCDHYPPTQFEQVPTMSFRDPKNASGSSCLDSEFVAWSPGDKRARRFTWSGNGVALSLSDSPTRVYISRITNTSTGGLALLGEEGKVAMMSTYRFASITVATGGLSVALRGASAENVTLLVARAENGFEVERLLVQIGHHGRASVQIH